MKRYIFVCSCSGVREKSIKAFKIIKPNDELPEIYVGKDKMRGVASTFPNDSNAAKYLSAVAKKTGRFAYFLEISNESSNILEMHDLLTGKRIF